MHFRHLCLVMVSLMAAQIYPENLRLMISEQQIKTRVAEVANQLDNAYQGKELVLIIVMKGAICLVADLMREIKIPTTLDYVQASSYGQNGMTAGTLTLRGIENLDLKDKHVLVIDDIFDTGHTMSEIKKELLKLEPASIKTLVLLLKNKPRRITELPDYALFNIENEFVIGYGLDLNELYRGLPGIYVFEN